MLKKIRVSEPRESFFNVPRMVMYWWKICLFILLSLSTNLYAVTATWDAGVDSVWDYTTTNWTGAIFANGDDAIFNATGAGTVTLGTNFNTAGMVFNSAGYIIADGGITNFNLSAPATITANADARINALITGTSGLTKNGNSKLTIRPSAGNWDCLPSGIYTINSGALEIDASTTANDSRFQRTYYINNGSTLRFYNDSSRHIFNGTAFRFDSNGGGLVSVEQMNPIWRNVDVFTLGGLKSVLTTVGTDLNGQNVFSNPFRWVIVPGTDPSGIDFEFAGDANRLKILKSGEGRASITGNKNAIPGGIQINNGSIEVAGAGRLNYGNYAQIINVVNADCAFDYNSTAAQTIGGIIQGAGTLTKDNTSTLVLSASNTIEGVITVDGGILKLGNNAGLGSTNANTIVNDGGALDLQGFAPTPGEKININGVGSDGVGTRGALYSTANDGVLGAESTLILNSNVEVGGGGGRINNFGGIFDALNSFTVTKYGAEHWYQFGGNVNIGSLVVTPNAWWGQYLPKSPRTVTFQAGSQHHTWSSPNFGTLTMTLEDGVQFHNDWEPGYVGTAVYGGNITLNGTAKFYSTRPEQTVRINAVINGTGSIEKNNDHTLVLTAANTYSNTTVNGGTVRVESNSGLGSGDVTIGNGSLDVGATTNNIQQLDIVNATGKIVFELTNTNALPLFVEGNVNLNGLGTLAITNQGLLEDGAYTVITSKTAIVGQFTGLEIQNPDVNADIVYINDGADHRVVIDVFDLDITNGFNLANNKNVLQWNASPSQSSPRIFDIIYYDSDTSHPGWHENIAWSKLGEISSNEYEDTTLDSLGDKIRFYKVANKGRWENNGRASKTTYATKTVLIDAPSDPNYVGENFISLFFEPKTNTLQDIMGTNQLPAGSTMAASTKLEFYGSVTNETPTNIVWLSNSSGWLYEDSNDANNMVMPLQEGFSVVLPEGAPGQRITLTGIVPTNTVGSNMLLPDGTTSIPIAKKTTTGLGGGTFNLVSWPFPYRVMLKDSGLREAGFGYTPGTAFIPLFSDEIRIMGRGWGVNRYPEYMIIMDSSQQFKFWYPNRGSSAENFMIGPDDTIIIYTRKSESDWNWTIPIPPQYKESSP